MVALRLVVLLVVVALSYGDSDVDSKELHDSPSTVDSSEVVDVPIAPETDVPKLRRDRRLAKGDDRCIAYLYVMAFTSGKKRAGSDRDHRIFLRASGMRRSARLLPNLPDDDYERNKGDLWKLPITFFGDAGCVKLQDVRSIILVGGSGDGWNIDSVVTFAISEDYYWALLSVDLDVFQWIGRNRGPNERRFPLSLIPRDDDDKDLDYFEFH